MKRIFKAMLLLVLCLATVAAMSSCGQKLEKPGADDKGEDGHTHEWGDAEITQEADRIIRKYTCSICNETKTDETTIESVVEGAQSWTDAFDNLELKNFEMKVFAQYGEYTHTNYCRITENAVYYHIEDGAEFYSVKNEDGTYTTYMRYGEDESFTKLNDTSDEYLVGAQTETIISVSFADYYDSFTYDEEQGAYLCEDIIEATAYDWDGNPMFALECYNNVVKVADGKITYISCDYNIDYGDSGPSTEDTKMSFVYYNIGLVDSVTVPQDVIDNAKEDTSTPEDSENNGNSSSDASGEAHAHEFGEEYQVVEIDGQSFVEMTCVSCGEKFSVLYEDVFPEGESAPKE